MGNKADTFKGSEDKPAGKTYHRPQLVMYGHIRELTKTAGGTMGMNDGGGGNDKTGF